MSDTTIDKLGLLTGDIGLSMGSSWVSKAIRFFETWHTQEAEFSHAWIAIDKELCVEALTRIEVNKLTKYDQPNEKVDIYRIPLSIEDRSELFLGLLGRINKGYGWFKIPLFALDAIATKISFWKKDPIFFFTKSFGLTNFMVCSHLVVWAIHKYTHYRFKDEDKNIVNWRTVSPDRLEDLLKMEHNYAKRVYTKRKELVKKTSFLAFGF